MKKIILISALAVLSGSCGGPSNGAALAKEVCDCYNKANALPADDPTREQAQDDCIMKQGEAWSKVKNNREQSDKFNDELSKCRRTQMEKSMDGN